MKVFDKVKFSNALFLIIISLSLVLFRANSPAIAGEAASHRASSSQRNIPVVPQAQKPLTKEEAFRQKFKGVIYEKGGKNKDIPKFIGNIRTKATDEAPKKVAREFLEENSQFLKLNADNLEEVFLNQRGNFQHVLYKQVYQGIPVETSWIMVHMRKNGQIISLESDYKDGLDDLKIETTPRIIAQEAVSTVSSDLGITEADEAESTTEEPVPTFSEDSGAPTMGIIAPEEKYPPTSELVIYPDTQGQFYLAWKITYTDSVKGSWIYYIDAQNGQILDFFDAAMHSADGTVYAQILPHDGENPDATVQQEMRDSYVVADYRVTHQNCYWVYPDCYWRNCFWCWWCWPPQEICEWYCPPRYWQCDPPWYEWFNSDVEETDWCGDYSGLYFPSDYDRYRIRFELNGSKCQAINDINNLYGFQIEMSSAPTYYPYEWDEPHDIDASLFDSANVFYHVNATLNNYYNDELDFNGLGYKLVCYTHKNTTIYQINSRQLWFGPAYNGKSMARDEEAIQHELQHAVTHKLYNFIYPDPWPDEFMPLNESFSYYFPCSQDGDPIQSEWITGTEDPWDISPFFGMEDWEDGKPHDNGKIYANALWDIRQNRGDLSVNDIDRIALAHITHSPLSFLAGSLAYITEADDYDCTSPQIWDMQYQFARRGIHPCLLFEDFEDGSLDGWKGLDANGELQDAPSGLWHASNFRTGDGSSYSLGYSRLIPGSDPPDYDYNVGDNHGDAILEIKHLDDIEAGFKTATIKFWHWWETESYSWPYYDIIKVSISIDGGNTWEEKAKWTCGDPNPSAWAEVVIPLDEDELVDSLLFRFNFDSGDGAYNNYEGWYIDDIHVEVTR